MFLFGIFIVYDDIQTRARASKKKFLKLKKMQHTWLMVKTAEGHRMYNYYKYIFCVWFFFVVFFSTYYRPLYTTNSFFYDARGKFELHLYLVSYFQHIIL